MSAFLRIIRYRANFQAISRLHLAQAAGQESKESSLPLTPGRKVFNLAGTSTTRYPRGFPMLIKPLLKVGFALLCWNALLAAQTTVTLIQPNLPTGWGGEPWQ